jgi:hypothetical protein
VKVIEGAPRRIHRRQLLPRLGDEHHQRVWQRAPAVTEEPDDVVEAERIAPVPRDDRPQLLAAFAIGEPELRRARLHPEAVTADGVDLAVMGDEAKRLGHAPGRQRVGRVALVEQDDGALVPRIAQIRVEERQIARQAERLVDQRPRRAGDDEEVGPAGGRGGALGRLAGQEESTLERVLVRPCRPSHQELLDARHRRLRLVAEGRRIDGHVPPGDRRDAGPAHTVFERAPGRCRLFVVRGKEGHGHTQVARRDIEMAGVLERGAEERQRHLGEYPGAVAGAGIGADAAAVGEIDETGQGAVDDLARRPARDVDDQPHTARVVFERGAPEGSLPIRGALRGDHDCSPIECDAESSARSFAAEPARGRSLPTSGVSRIRHRGVGIPA